MGIDVPYNALMNATTASKPIAIDTGKKHLGKRISLSEAYEKAGRIYENAEAQRQVLREQEARLFFGLLDSDSTAIADKSTINYLKEITKK